QGVLKVRVTYPNGLGPHRAAGVRKAVPRLHEKGLASRPTSGGLRERAHLAARLHRRNGVKPTQCPMPIAVVRLRAERPFDVSNHALDRYLNKIRPAIHGHDVAGRTEQENNSCKSQG